MNACKCTLQLTQDSKATSYSKLCYFSPFKFCTANFKELFWSIIGQLSYKALARSRTEKENSWNSKREKHILLPYGFQMKLLRNTYPYCESAADYSSSLGHNLCTSLFVTWNMEIIILTCFTGVVEKGSVFLLIKWRRKHVLIKSKLFCLLYFYFRSSNNLKYIKINERTLKQSSWTTTHFVVCLVYTLQP